MGRRNNILYTPKNTLFIPIGTPLMGKSTWLRRVLPPFATIISRDGIRKAISRPVSLGIGMFYETITDSTIEDHIENLWKEGIKWNMERGIPVAVDTTNLTHRGRHSLCTMAKEHTYHTVKVVFATSAEIRECLLWDIDILYTHAKDLYRNARKMKGGDYKRFLKGIGIVSPLCTRLLMRNYDRYKKEHIFINTRVLAAMLKRMYNDYPRDAYLHTNFKKIIFTDTPRPCIGRCHSVKHYKVPRAKPPQRPTMEGREW